MNFGGQWDLLTLKKQKEDLFKIWGTKKVAELFLFPDPCLYVILLIYFF